MIGGIMNKSWNDNVVKVQNKPLKIKPIYAIITYIFVVLGAYIFAYQKIGKDNWVMDALKWGFLWGIITYGIFDFTNLTIFEDYQLKTALIDTLWGGTLIALTVLITYFLMNKLKV
jgi:uncharacterized membrane protein